jgi:hypothetical protein
MEKMKILIITVIIIIGLYNNCNKDDENFPRNEVELKLFAFIDSKLRYILEIKNDRMRVEMCDGIVWIFPITPLPGSKSEAIQYEDHPISKLKDIKMLIDDKKKLLIRNFKIITQKEMILNSKEMEVVYDLIKKVDNIQNPIQCLESVSDSTKKYRLDLSDLDIINECCDFRYSVIIVSKKIIVLRLAEIYLYSDEIQVIAKNISKIFSFSPIKIVLNVNEQKNDNK